MQIMEFYKKPCIHLCIMNAPWLQVVAMRTDPEGSLHATTNEKWSLMSYVSLNINVNIMLTNVT